MSNEPQSYSAKTTAVSLPNPYLSRPSHTIASPTTRKSDITTGTKHETRVYIGNLHSSVDEYVLIQTFSKFGKITKLDFLFHKSGAQRGQPRGYAFVEYDSPHEALQAVAGAHDKTLRGKRICVMFATKSSGESEKGAGRAGGVGPHRRDRRQGVAGEVEANKTTQLSLSKNAKTPQGTDAKIAVMEAKLAKMRQSKSQAAASTTALSSSTSTSAGRFHSSLPAKPNFESTDSATGPKNQQRQRPK
ncbi:uncharacterized protein MEPE_05026 [Melanopsichium pennsylvanicum]|uniref:RRM domain-containing protein n=2 Tax=Melanopsichium pennsylvanicum TaxID=63383 RepID=A0AAJ4XQ20_9BASI